MPIVRYGEKLNVLVAAKGHPYLRDPFMAMFDETGGRQRQPRRAARGDAA